MYFITGLPRSRTTWFAAYFTTIGSRCLHEALNGCQTKEDFNRRMEDVDGNSDCGLIFTDFQQRFPRSKTVIVHRDPKEVGESLKAIDLEMSADLLNTWAFKLRELEGLHVEFGDIDDRLSEITQYVMGKSVPFVEKLMTNMVIVPKEITGDPASLKVWVN